MAAIDSLLRLISERGADALTIASDAVPELRRGGENQPLSMPPLSRDLVALFVNEIGGRDTRSYTSADATYAVAVETVGGGTRATFSLRPHEAPRAEASPAPAGPATVVAPARVEMPSASSAATATAPTPAPASRAPGAPASARRQAVAPAAHADSLAALLALVDERDASDLLLSSDSDAWLRVEGRMQPVPGTALGEADLLDALGVDPAALDGAGSLDFALVAGRRFRVNVFRQQRGVAAALRPIRRTPPTLDRLHLPTALHELVGFPNGLVLVAGTAGSGKSTTLAALVEHLNATASRHIITLEDPVEYEYASRRCLIHQREIGVHVPDFATGLRAALRESPDIILVGELRDRETMAAAMTAAETGHLVIGTIHARSAEGAVDRVLDSFSGDQQRQIRSQLAQVLRATLTQFLLDSPMPPGRAPAIELMKVNNAIAAHIRDRKTYQIPSAIQTGRAAGMMSLEHSLAQLVRSGSVERSVAEAAAVEPDLLRQLLASRR